MKRSTKKQVTKPRTKRGATNSRKSGFKQSVAPSAVATHVTNKGPQYNGRPTVRIQHHEVVGTIRNTVLNSFSMFPQVSEEPGWDIAPGNPALFPWLSAMAANYEFYHFHNLEFTLVASMSTATSGRVYLAIDYDWDDDVPATFQGMMNNQTATENNVWATTTLRANPEMLHENQKWKFVRTAGREAPEPRTTYCGFLMVGTNTPSNCIWDLHVSYDVEFRSPQAAGIVEPEFAVTVGAPLVHTNATTDGHTLAQLPLPTLPNLKKATVPNTVVINGVNQGGQQALDLAFLNKGILDVKSLFAANASPETLLSYFAGNSMVSFFYDSLWNLLGTNHDIVGGDSIVAPLSAATFATPGGYVVARTALSVLAARATAALAGFRYVLTVLDLDHPGAGDLTGLTGSCSIRTEL